FLSVFAFVVSYAQDNSDTGPTCFDVSLLPGNHPYYIENSDQYVVCVDQTVTIIPTLNAPLRRTDMYDVEQIPFNPYPTSGPELTDILVTNVDAYADAPIPIPFKFCFFDQTYTDVYVHGNNYLGFSNTGTPPSQAINDPQDAIPTSLQGYVNTIMLFKHNHWQTGSPGAIRYAVYGEAPCRVFVVTFLDLLAYQLSPQLCPPSVVDGQTSQFVLHETTNFIDIIVTRHNSCPLTPAGWAVMGINKDASQGYSPPGRNLGTFD